MYHNLEAILTKRNISVKSLSKQIGISPQSLYNKLNGITPFTINECLKIQQCLNSEMPIDILFENEKKEAAVNLPQPPLPPPE